MQQALNRLEDAIPATGYDQGGTVVEFLRQDDRIDITTTFPENQGLISDAIDGLRYDDPGVLEGIKRQYLVDTERVCITPDPKFCSIGITYADIHPTKRSLTLQRVEFPHDLDVTDEFLSRELEKTLKRYAHAIEVGDRVPEMKVTDIIAYQKDTILSTAIFLQDQNGNVLLQQRAPDLSFGLYCQPSANGKLETWEQALERELGEELGEGIQQLVGQNPDSVKLLGQSGYILKKKGVEKPAVGRTFAAYVDRATIDHLVSPDPQEVADILWVSLDDLRSGRIVPKSQVSDSITPQTHLVLFDDQYEQLKLVLENQ